MASSVSRALARIQRPFERTAFPANSYCVRYSTVYSDAAFNNAAHRFHERSPELKYSFPRLYHDR